MGQITVMTNEIKSKADELNALNEQFKAAVNELESLESSFSGMWEGTAKEAFHNAFTSDKSQMNNFSIAISLYVQKLMEILNKYAQAENTNAETAIQRKYK